jgi:energy-coupling factor transport system ATP-binding protein
MIEIRDLVHIYNREESDGIGDSSSPNEVQALDGLSLSVADGEFVAIIGHNGCGKSTLAKHLNGLLLPTSGDVWIKGMNTKDKEHLWEIRQKVGMIFQNPDNQLVAAVVEEDIAFGCENLGIPPEEIRERVDSALTNVDMLPFRWNVAHLLSGGQKQRVAIAGVIAMRPECIVLDEPTTMLDPEGKREVLQTVKKLNREGITIVYITHSMKEAIEARRVIVMSDGRIEMEGTPRYIFSQVERMRELRLNVPQMTELAYELRRSGVDIPLDIVTVEEMLSVLSGESSDIEFHPFPRGKV